MYRVGLTGNVASGKSTVARLFAAWGAALVDADALAREAVAPGSVALGRVLERFPVARAQSGGLDRAALRRHVMADAGERAALNAIVHPEVERLRREREAAFAPGAIVVHDIPLLFEVLDPAAFDAVVLVDAPPAERRRRLMAERGLAAADADALIAAQAPADAKRARSTFIIENGGTPQELESRARDVWRELQERAGAV